MEKIVTYTYDGCKALTDYLGSTGSASRPIKQEPPTDASGSGANSRPAGSAGQSQVEQSLVGIVTTVIYDGPSIYRETN